MLKYLSKYFFLLFTVILFSTVVKASAVDSLNYFQGNFSEAKVESKKENKSLMIIFSTSWCTYCKKLKDTTLKDKNIISYINSHFILLEQNAEKPEGKIIASSFGVTSYPTIVFLNPEEKPLMTSEGFHEVADMMELLKSIPEK